MFRQTDLTRALKGTRAAGIEIDHIEIDKNGKIIVFPREPSEAVREGNADANGEKISDLDTWIAEHAREPQRHQPGYETARGWVATNILVCVEGWTAVVR